MRIVPAAIVLAFAVMTLAACSPTSVEANDYDQSCAKDDDCVAVSELHTHGTDCSMGCDPRAINKKDKAQYDEDLDDERGKCGSMTSAFCDVTGSPTCVKGKCEMK